MGFTCMLPFISEYAVVVNLLEQLQRRSDSSLRRRKTVAEKFGAGGMERLALYMNGKEVGEGEGEIPRTIPFRYSAEEREFRCSRVYDTGSHL
jgi:hypothetical protein